jgi:hypothetical protein
MAAERKPEQAGQPPVTPEDERVASQVPGPTQPAEEWGERQDHASTIATGGKEPGKAPGK